jgi:DNA primase
MDRATIEMVLYKMGIDIVHFYNRSVMVKCPFGTEHAGGDDTHASLSIDVNSSVWHCFGCERRGKTLRSLVWQWCEAFGLDYKEWRDKCFGDAQIERIEIEYNRLLQSSYEAGGSNRNIERPHITLEVIDYYLKAHGGKVPGYVTGRGVTLAVCEEALLGYDERRQKVIPIRSLPDGELVGGMTRGIQKSPDYFFTRGFKKIVLYLEYETYKHPFRSPLIITEGGVDALVLRSYEYNGVAILGSSMNDAQGMKALTLSQQISSVYNGSDVSVVVMMDADEAGLAASQLVIKSLKEAHKVFPVYVAHLKRGDPADASREEIQECIMSVEKI